MRLVRRVALIAAVLVVALTQGASAHPPHGPSRLEIPAMLTATHLRWLSSSSRQAVAVGTLRVDDCNETCSGGSWHTVYGHIVLSRPVQCDSGILVNNHVFSHLAARPAPGWPGGILTDDFPC